MKVLPELTFAYYISVGYDLIKEVTGLEEFSEEEFIESISDMTVACMCTGFLLGRGLAFEDIQNFAEDHESYSKSVLGRQEVKALFVDKRG